jgi:TRAP-type C4-dicarboxylate transport system substrate-binding protein
VKKLTAFLVVTLLVTALVIVGCNSSPAEPTPAPTSAPPPSTPAQPAKVSIELPALGSPADQARVADLAETAEVITEATNGRAEVTIHYGDTLVPPPDYYRAVTEGIADIAMVQPMLSPGTFPLQELFSMPGLFQIQSQSIFAMYDIYHMYPQFEAEFSPKVKVLSNFSLMTSDIHSTIPIRSLAELKGKTIVAQDETTVKILQALGANASVMPGPDMYLAAERGVIEGGVVPWGFVDGEKLYEQFKYHTQLNISPVCFAYVMNMDTFNKFTPEEQANLERSWFDLVRPTISRNIHVVLRGMQTYLAQPDQEIISFPAADYEQIKALTKPIKDAWVAKLNDKGYPGQEILDNASMLAQAYLEN